MRDKALRPELVKEEDRATPYDFEKKRFVRRFDPDEALRGRVGRVQLPRVRMPRVGR